MGAQNFQILVSYVGFGIPVPSKKKVNYNYHNYMNQLLTLLFCIFVIVSYKLIIYDGLCPSSIIKNKQKLHFKIYDTLGTYSIIKLIYETFNIITS